MHAVHVVQREVKMERRLKKYLKGGKFENVSKTTSKTMSAIRGKNNKTTELRLRMALVRSGITGFKLHEKLLPGKPDIYFIKEQLAIFIDGCFWHGCPKCGHIPKTRSAFWKAKIERNIERDKKNKRELRKQGITHLKVWEHELKNKVYINKTVHKIKKCIENYEKNNKKEN